MAETPPLSTSFQMERKGKECRGGRGMRLLQHAPPPPSASHSAERWISSWSLDSAPRCQEGAPAAAGFQVPGWNSVSIHHPAASRPVRGAGSCPEQGTQPMLSKPGPWSLVLLSGRNWVGLGWPRGLATVQALFQPQPHFLGMKVPRAPSHSSLGMPCGPGCGGCG